MSCRADQILILPRWGAAAGSYGGTWQFANISDRSCSFHSPARAVLRDRTGKALLRSEPWPEPTDVVVVPPGGVAEANVLWSNWCSDETELLIRIALPDDGGSLTIVPPGTAPCTGPADAGSTLSVEPFIATTKGIGLAPAIPVQQAPNDLAVGAGGVWVTGQDRMLRLDTEGRTVWAFELGHADGALIGGGSDVAVGEGQVWVTCSCGSEPDPRFGSTSGGLVRIDPETNRVTGTRIFTDRTPDAVVATDGAVWLGTGNTITRLSPDDLRIEATIRLGSDLVGLAEGRKRLWALLKDAEGYFLARISTSTNGVTARWRLPGEPSGLVEHSSVLVTIPAAGRLLKIDVRTGKSEAFDRFTSADAVAAGGGSIWVYDAEEGVVSRLDEVVLRTTDTFEVGTDLRGIWLGTGAAWLLSYRNSTVTRIAA